MALGSPQTLRLIALGLGGLAALVAAMDLTRTTLSEDTGHVITDDALRGTLARCRGLTPEGYASDTDCRAAWEAARRRFFGLAPDRNPAPAGTE